ncbi:MAG TPA: hypothetical protein VEX36_05785 [Thermoleophilaceae bacterium]|nr:hypothetical protein [Thermoleophilaceae bacterium]
MALAGVAGTPAVGQKPGYTFEVKLDVVPRKAGTENRPRGSTLKGRFVAGQPLGQEPPVITAGRVLLPRGIAYNGDKYPRCSKVTLQNDADECPKRSIMGAGSGNAYADTVITTPKLVFYNGGANWMYAYTTYFNPAFVQEPVPIQVKRLSGRRWSYEIEFGVPYNLQVIAGVPITPSDVPFSVGGKAYARDYLATNAGCPKRGFRPYVVSLDYRFYPDGATGTSVDRGRLACR